MKEYPIETRLGWAERSIARVKAALAPWADEMLTLDDQDAGYMAERVAARLTADEADQDRRLLCVLKADEDRDAAIREMRAALLALAELQAREKAATPDPSSLTHPEEPTP